MLEFYTFFSSDASSMVLIIYNLPKVVVLDTSSTGTREILNTIPRGSTQDNEKVGDMTTLKINASVSSYLDILMHSMKLILIFQVRFVVEVVAPLKVKFSSVSAVD